MEKKPFFINHFSAISPLGMDVDSLSDAWFDANTSLKLDADLGVFSGKLESYCSEVISELRRSEKRYKHLDRSALLAIAVSRQLRSFVAVGDIPDTGINIASSRGATTVFEESYKHFLKTGESSVQTSPSTTLGNISSWVAQDLGFPGINFSHSVTCSSGLHALLNGMAWIGSGMSKQFLVGAAEAPLTAFTVSQMQGMNVYSDENSNFPCRAMDISKQRNTMVLGEGAVSCLLSSEKTSNDAVCVSGYGFAAERLESPTSLSKSGFCLVESMEMALRGIEKENIDVVITHAPGTLRGDESELTALKAVFGESLPFLANTKWKIGHTFGASGLFNLVLGMEMLRKQQVPYQPFLDQVSPTQIRSVLLNAVGFGGNAVSVVLTRA